MEIKSLFETFQASYNEGLKNEIWENHSQKFRDFWSQRIMADGAFELADQEIDDIVRILDRNGRGNTRDSDSVAKAMIPQGAWRRMFNELQKNNNLSKKLDKLFEAKDDQSKINLINSIYETNQGNRNYLTGNSGNAINALLAAYDPFNNISIISLKDRLKWLEYLVPGFTQNNIDQSQGFKMILTNNQILDFFKTNQISGNARTISVFAYSSVIKNNWKISTIEEVNESIEEKAPQEIEIGDYEKTLLFYMENQLEDFLIENWDMTELGSKFELIEKDGELLSQQYRTSIGIIDILAIDKKTGRHVVIELKKGQTSDQTIGQLARYMGWVEENLSQGIESIGIIIAGYYDEKLNYAVRKIKDVEVFLYKIDFKLSEFKK